MSVKTVASKAATKIKRPAFPEFDARIVGVNGGNEETPERRFNVRAGDLPKALRAYADTFPQAEAFVIRLRPN